MLQRFLAVYPVTGGPAVTESPDPTPRALRACAGGRSFADGLYRIHTHESGAEMLKQIDAAFPDAPPHTMPYGFDWLGRQFCAQRDDEHAPSLMFEPGTGEVLEIPVPFALMHDEELVDYGNDALATDFFREYLASGAPGPGLTQCVGYRIPLFLGGQDALPNLELTDMDLYWHLAGQLTLRSAGLPSGTKIDSTTIE